MIDLTALLQDGPILLGHPATSRKQVLCDLAEALALKTGLETRDVFDAVMERERLGSTGVGEGIAIPHARLEGLEKPVGGFMRLAEPIDFEALDDQPCDLVFMLLAPEKAGADHLRALAAVSRAFRQSSVRTKLREAETEEAVRTVLCRTKADTAA